MPDATHTTWTTAAAVHLAPHSIPILQHARVMTNSCIPRIPRICKIKYKLSLLYHLTTSR